MADNVDVPDAASGNTDGEELEETPGYKAPAQKSLKEINELDQDDEALVKYKKTLLGSGETEAVLGMQYSP